MESDGISIERKRDEARQGGNYDCERTGVILGDALLFRQLREELSLPHRSMLHNVTFHKTRDDAERVRRLNSTCFSRGET